MLTKIFISFITLIYLNPLFAKSIEGMAKSAERALSRIGISFLTLAILYGGLLYLKSGAEGKQKIQEAITGGFYIIGFAAIVALLRSIVG